MKKFDLRNGMAVKLRDMSKIGDSKFGLVVDNLIYLKDKKVSFLGLYNYDENLVFNKDECNYYDVIEVYKIKATNKIDVFMEQKDDSIELIWKRDEFDWGKVPVGARVMVSDDCDEWREGYYLSYDVTEEYVHKFLDMDKEYVDWFKYCKLVEEQVNKEVAYEELLKEFNDKVCHVSDCDSCEYNGAESCDLMWITDNYNVTRK